MKRKKFTVTVLSAIIGFAVASCSESGDNDSSGSNLKNYTLASSVNSEETAGNYRKYSLSGEIGAITDKTSYTATVTMSTTQASINGLEAYDILQRSASVNAKLGTGEQTTNVINDYFVLGNDNERYWILTTGSDGYLYAVNEYNGFRNPLNDINENTNGSTAYTFDICSDLACENPINVAATQESLVVVGTETISTALGKFETYKINLTSKTTTNSSAFSARDITSTAWYYPSLGVIKSNTSAATIVNGITVYMDVTETLIAQKVNGFSARKNKKESINDEISALMNRINNQLLNLAD